MVRGAACFLIAVAPRLAAGTGVGGGLRGAQGTNYQPRDPALLAASSAPLNVFYMYRAVSDEVYPPMNVNAGNLAGVLWYLHHEVVIQYPRKFGITKIIRLKVETRATQPVLKLGMNFGPRLTYDKGQCTGPYVCGRDTAASGTATGVQPKLCSGPFQASYTSDIVGTDGKPYGGAFEWRKYGFLVGCNALGDYPYPMFPVYYPNATWYSLPGPCPSMAFSNRTQDCVLQEPGGYCKGTPTGRGDCTWTYENAGEIYINELVGAKPGDTPASGWREYDPIFDKGNKFSWWDGINSTANNQRRLDAARSLFSAKYPSMPTDEELPTPACDFNFGRFYHEFYGRDLTAAMACEDAQPGSNCYKSVQWIMKDGLQQHPEWYPDLSPTSSFKEFQMVLYLQGSPACPTRPCE